MSEPRVRLRPEVESMVAYRQGKPAAADAFKLSSNENPYPPLPGVLESIAASTINRYPDATAAELRAALADRFGVSDTQVQVGSGSVAVLSQIIQSAAAPGDEIVYAWRSFEAYPTLVAATGATSVPVANTEDHRHDLAALADAITDRTRVVIVCSPNNPTSTIVTRSEFLEFMALVPSTVLVVLDEAYFEFVTDPDAIDGATVIHDYSNLVILRTFSKAYGLAGLRIGYAIGPEYVMDAARAVAIPLSVTEPAQRAALTSLELEEQLLERVAALVTVRDEIVAGLEAQGWSIPAPQGNFIWLDTGDDTTEAAEIFVKHGIVTRALGEGLRVSVGERESVEKLLRAAEEVVQMRRTTASTLALD